MRKKICIALMAAFTVLLGVSSYFIIDHYREAEHQEQMYDSLVQLVEDSETEPAEPIIYSEDKTILPELTELYRQNDDLVGWICVEDTNINYPVMQTVDNPNYYLKRGFDKEYSSYGCPYVQEDCDVLKPSDNLVIYGHHMNDGSMFNVISDTTDQATFDSMEYVYYITRDATYKLRPLATKVVEDTYAKARTPNFEGDDGLKNYLSEMLDGASAMASDATDRAASATKVVTLVTCRSLSLSNTRAVMVLTPVEE